MSRADKLFNLALLALTVAIYIYAWPALVYAHHAIFHR